MSQLICPWDQFEVLHISVSTNQRPEFLITDRSKVRKASVCKSSVSNTVKLIRCKPDPIGLSVVSCKETFFSTRSPGDEDKCP